MKAGELVSLSLDKNEGIGYAITVIYNNVMEKEV